MVKLKKLPPKIKDAFNYGLPTYLNTILGIFTVPVIAYQLGVADYGRLELFNLFLVVLNYLFHFGWSSSHNRYFLEDGINRENLIATLLKTRLVTFFFVAVFLYLLKDTLLDFATIEIYSEELFVCLFVSFFATEFSHFYIQKYRMLDQSYLCWDYLF